MSEGVGALAPIGVLGGTFNPVHYGHLRSALELVEHLQLDHLRLMPCAVPPHRDAPTCSAQHRAAMVELAVATEPRLVCDRRELQRAGTSYTIDSLRELRREFGWSRSICVVVGCDAVRGIEHWHRWRELLDWAHIAVLARPGWHLPRDGVVAQWLESHRADSPAALRRQVSGSILIEALRPLAISSTEIRQLLWAGRSARYLLPEPVLEYIARHELYRKPRPEPKHGTPTV
ncbi:MAG: nicotinate-nucleotide adenylyltransferase [Halioglobus sp.]|nr:nicotinate-nucleotide adenylyltransferase [Halioglobus sp.]